MLMVPKTLVSDGHDGYLEMLQGFDDSGIPISRPRRVDEWADPNPYPQLM